MSGASVPRSQILRIVDAANRAPSGDNCQPWRFRYAGEELSVVHDGARAAHALNHQDACSYLALGAVLESMEIAASVLALSAEPRLMLDAPAGRPWAAVRFAPSDGPPHPLSGAILRRASDRRLHQRGSPPEAVLSALRADGERFADAALHVQDRIEPELMSFLLDCDAYIWRHPRIVEDIVPWIRLTQREVEETRDGIPWRALGLDVPVLPGLRLLRWRPLPRVADRMHLHSVTRAWLRLTLLSAGALLCVTVRSLRKEALVSAGRLGFLAWVRFNEAGWGVQPLTVQSLPIYHLETGGLPSRTRPEFHELYRRGRDVVARGFGYPSDELPVWMFRTGRSRPLPAALGSLRKRPEEVTEFASDPE